MGKIEFGRKYRDKISGFEGIATGISEYLSGCNQVLLTPKVSPDNNIEAHWIDAQRLEKLPSDEIIELLPASPPCLQLIKLGYTYQDVISGFKGVAVGRGHYLGRNVDDILLSPPVGGDGKKRDAEWYPESYLKLVEVGQIRLENGKKPGSDKAAPKY